MFTCAIRWCTTSLLLFFFFIAQALPKDSLETGIDAVMSPFSGKNRPGAVIAIIQKGRLVFQKGYGMANVDNRLENSANVGYKLASVSKQFTAAAIFQLIGTGKIQLTDDIKTYLPAFPDYGSVITISDLLYHTSGIRDYMVLMWLGGVSFESQFRNEDALNMIYRQAKLNFLPGDRCVYSNSNYILLAEIVRQITGKQLSQYANENLFALLGMSRSGFNGFGVQKDLNKAISYEHVGNTFRAFENDNETFGDGGLLSTLDDLLIWDRTFYDAESVSNMLLRPGKLKNGNNLHYGAGIMLGTYRGKVTQTHPGAFLGYRTEILRFPLDSISIICLANTDEINPEDIAKKVANVFVFNELAHAPVIRPDINIREVHSYLGKYEVNSTVYIEIGLLEGQLFGQATGQERQMLSVTDLDHKFRIGNTNDYVSFVDKDKGYFRQLTISQGTTETTARRVEILKPEHCQTYIGNYKCAEQGIEYEFYLKDGNLWFKAGAALAIKADIEEKSKKLFFDYKNLEKAVITFDVDDTGQVNGFMLETGRVKDLLFVKL